MTKADLVSEIAISTGYDRTTISIIVESLMENVKKSVAEGDNVYLRGFGCFTTKTRAAKVARNITKSTSIQVPAHKVPFFLAYPEFAEEVRKLKVE